MLDFWYSEKCTREIKLIICIITCAIIYYFSNIEQLNTWAVGFSLGIGVFIHVLHHLKLKLNTHNKYSNGLNIIVLSLPIIAILFLIQSIPPINKMILIVQSLGFVGLGFFIVSIYENRSKRS
ncbi:hypothetical protein [Acinetobacter portensis]|uniref:hypothetical protein n=1 Tax=Acinetobacter portensis TaxID=1839785 RepID=UPI0013D1249E|nr:hypothetical protein [Acinetobacter portensis]